MRTNPFVSRQIDIRIGQKILERKRDLEIIHVFFGFFDEAGVVDPTQSTLRGHAIPWVNFERGSNSSLHDSYARSALSARAASAIAMSAGRTPDLNRRQHSRCFP